MCRDPEYLNNTHLPGVSPYLSCQQLDFFPSHFVFGFATSRKPNPGPIQIQVQNCGQRVQPSVIVISPAKERREIRALQDDQPKLL